MNENRLIRSVPSTDSSKHERPGWARARYAEIGVMLSATNDRVMEVRLSGSSAVVTSIRGSAEYSGNPGRWLVAERPEFGRYGATSPTPEWTARRRRRAARGSS